MKSPACAGLFFVLRGLPGSGCSAFRPGMLWHLAPRTSHLAHGSPSASRGSAAPSLSTLGRLAGRPWRPPSLLRQSSAFRSGKAAARPMYLFGLRPLHLCGTRLEGGHQGLSRQCGSVDGEPWRGGGRRRSCAAAFASEAAHHSGSCGESLIDLRQAPRICVMSAWVPSMHVAMGTLPGILAPIDVLARVSACPS